jgi:hypothetical protein
LTVRKPTAGKRPPATARVCAIPREQLRIDDLTEQIKTTGFEVPRARLGAGPWSLEPPGVTRLMEKMCGAGVPLKTYTGKVPLYGIKTGFNDAFVMDTATKEQLVAADPKSADLFRPFLRGQDIQRWRAEWSGLWMLAMKSSGNHPWPWSGAGDQAEAVFGATYPTIHAYLNQFRAALTKRQDQGEHWWELRACAYWDQFDVPKIVYPDLTWRPSFCLDPIGTLIGDTTFFVPVDDLWVLAVLNSPAMWAWLWRNTLHGKDEVLRLKTIYTEKIPLPAASQEHRSEIGIIVPRLITLAGEDYESRKAILDWLRVEFGVEKPSQKLQDVASLDADSLIGQVKKARGKAKGLSVAEVKRLREEHANSVAPLQALAAEARQLESTVADLVNRAYGLTPAEVKLVWDTAPPRMPGLRPTA